MFEGGLAKMPSPDSEEFTLRPPSVIEGLRVKKARLEKQLADVNSAISILEKQPGIIEAIDALRKVGL